jgi:hypothetical protein
MAWSEAFALFVKCNNESELSKLIKFDPETEEEALQMQKLHTEEDPWLYPILKYLDATDGNEKYETTTRDIWREALKMPEKEAKAKDMNHIAQLLDNCVPGWTRGKRARRTKYVEGNVKGILQTWRRIKTPDEYRKAVAVAAEEQAKNKD